MHMWLCAVRSAPPPILFPIPKSHPKYTGSEHLRRRCGELVPHREGPRQRRIKLRSSRPHLEVHISKVAILITHITGLMTLLKTTHEPPSSRCTGSRRDDHMHNHWKKPFHTQAQGPSCYRGDIIKGGRGVGAAGAQPYIDMGSR